MNDIQPKTAATDVAALPNAVDLWHHLNVLSRSRKTSPLKEIIKYMAQDGMISLAGGEKRCLCYANRAVEVAVQDD
jgi:hypothetical protein